MYQRDMIINMDKPTHSPSHGKYAAADAKRRAARPVSMFLPGFAKVCATGYQWGPRPPGRVSDGLAPLRPLGTSYRFIEIPHIDNGDTYLEFATATASKDGLLNLANRYGPLRDAPSEETLSDWFNEVCRFQAAFKTWLELKEKRHTRENVHLYVISEDLRKVHRSAQKRPYKEVMERFLDSVNQNILMSKLTLGLSGGTDIGSIEYSIVPIDLISAVWLQFAQLISGQKKIRQCEICREWMDVSRAARPNAKKVHTECSHALSVKKWRHKKKGDS